ncbi:transcription termination/antitermination factor NusG [Ehrlichia ruminantium]|uniref:Transcription termination/antitermination protein NusG n=1 Tax=Ehrlichia ruminantium TaxID=779 RepID=A0AAE6Q9X6_EHRRU|nr:transcription termination/antitermination protein NusG [Ehrlichia ruminantium]QGR02250.1 transcription termination/antitermination factor NusG [Ehrlichia ruminantium]QGR03172.1 transcription termination/antitermination factor NusG [Ehrlichia ruminantium]QGR04097.1 transcription termination/antitermination factor NusG [Ehrlichia ruminantium]
MKYEWYIIQVSSGSEDKVCQAILDNSKILGMAENFREVFIPYEEVTRVKHNKKVLVKRKLSPGYVFLYMNLNEDSVNFVRSIPKVLNFLNNDFGVPKVIAESEMESMRRKMCQSVVDDTNVINFDIGDEVVINDGLFQDFNGKVEYINEDKKVAGVSVMIFGRLTKIEFKLEHIQKVEG